MKNERWNKNVRFSNTIWVHNTKFSTALAARPSPSTKLNHSMKQHHSFRLSPRKRSNRSAFTFIEVLLVLTIIVAIAALSWPQMSRFLQRESVMANAEQVRQLLDHARVQAVEDGVTYQFRYEPNGQKFVLLPYELLSTPTSQSSSNSQQTQTATEIDRAIVYELTEDCYFYIPTTLSGETTVMERLGDPWLELIQNGSSHRDVSWSSPILYSPDGTAIDGAVTVADEDRRYISLSVRGLTGAVVTSRIDQLPELFGASTN